MCLARAIAILLLLGGANVGCSRRDERLDLTRYVSIYPGSPIVELAADQRTITVVVRNVSENKLTALALAVKSSACAATVTPTAIAELVPGDRKSFTVALTRRRELRRQRYPLALTLRAQGLPVPAGLDLLVDTSPPPERGWIDVGQVTLVSGSGARTTYYILGAAPLVLLLGWLLWRWSRPRRPAGDDSA